MIQRRFSKGFTLIELMIVVAVIGILASIAYPAYTDSVRKGKRAQARTALLEVMQQQERFMTQSNTYLGFSTTPAGVLSATGYTATTFPLKYYSGDAPSAPAYWLSAAECTSSTLRECVTVTATPTFSDPAVGALSLTSAGAKGCDGTASSSNPKLCWP